MLFTQHFALIYEAHTSLAFTLRHPPSSPLPLSPLPSHWTICVVTHAEDRGRKPALSTSNQVIYQISIDCCSSFHGEETTRGRGRGQESMALRCGGGGWAWGTSQTLDSVHEDDNGGVDHVVAG